MQGNALSLRLGAGEAQRSIENENEEADSRRWHRDKSITVTYSEALCVLGESSGCDTSSAVSVCLNCS